MPASSPMTTTCGAAITTQASCTARSDAELHRQRTDAEAAIALDRLEVVQGHDPVRAEAVQERERNDPASGRLAAMTAAPVNHGKPS